MLLDCVTKKNKIYALNIVFFQKKTCKASKNFYSYSFKIFSFKRN